MPGYAPVTKPPPAPFNAPKALPLVGAMSCAGGVTDAAATPIVPSSDRTSSDGGCGARGIVWAHPHGPIPSATTSTSIVARSVAHPMALPPGACRLRGHRIAAAASPRRHENVRRSRDATHTGRRGSDEGRGRVGRDVHVTEV